MGKGGGGFAAASLLAALVPILGGTPGCGSESCEVSEICSVRPGGSGGSGGAGGEDSTSTTGGNAGGAGGQGESSEEVCREAHLETLLSTGDENFQITASVAVDSGGNAVVVGAYQGFLGLGGIAPAPDGSWAIFVAKIAQNGEVMWSRNAGIMGPSDINPDVDPTLQSIRDLTVAVDQVTNAVVVAGPYADTLDFGGGPITAVSSNDVFVAKLAANGDYIWSRSFGGAGDQIARNVAIDSAGRIGLAGVFEGDLDFGTGPLSAAGSADVFVAMFDSEGNTLWSQGYGDGNYQAVKGLAVDGEGNFYLAGTFTGTLEFGVSSLRAGSLKTAKALSGKTLNAYDSLDEARLIQRFVGASALTASDYDAWVAKIGSDGTPVWAKQFGSLGGFETAKYVVVGPAGELALAGNFDTSFTFGSNGWLLLNRGGLDLYLAGLDPASGEPTARPPETGGLLLSIGGTGNEYWNGGVSLTSQGPVLVLNTEDSELSLGNGIVLTQSPGTTTVAAQLGWDGTVCWALAAEGPFNFAYGMAVRDDELWTVGSYYGYFGFDGYAVDSSGLYDAYVVQIAPPLE